MQYLPNVQQQPGLPTDSLALQKARCLSTVLTVVNCIVSALLLIVIGFFLVNLISSIQDAQVNHSPMAEEGLKALMYFVMFAMVGFPGIILVVLLITSVRHGLHAKKAGLPMSKKDVETSMAVYICLAIPVLFSAVFIAWAGIHDLVLVFSETPTGYLNSSPAGLLPIILILGCHAVALAPLVLSIATRSAVKRLNV